MVLAVFSIFFGPHPHHTLTLTTRSPSPHAHAHHTLTLTTLTTLTLTTLTLTTLTLTTLTTLTTFITLIITLTTMLTTTHSRPAHIPAPTHAPTHTPTPCIDLPMAGSTATTAPTTPTTPTTPTSPTAPTASIPATPATPATPTTPATSTPLIAPAAPAGFSKSPILHNKYFENRLDHLVASGAFNNDYPRRAKGLRAHIKRCLESWEFLRIDRIYWEASISISILKWSLKIVEVNTLCPLCRIPNFLHFGSLNQLYSYHKHTLFLLLYSPSITTYSSPANYYGYCIWSYMSFS
ncbi:hypothetical protein EV426DRAFT_91479 [Tirmania nivea]|nr:hypothetical protein EV426DRAFT_91479 [Tirmania nivea]